MELVSLLYLLGNTMPGSRCIFLSRGAGDGKDHSQSSVASNTDNQLALEPNLASGTSAHHEGDPRIMAFGKKSGRHISLWGSDFAELACLGLVSRARMKQIMSLLNLAPDIQEQVLFLPGTSRGQDAVTERHLRPLTMELDWEAQRVKWGGL